MFQIHGLEIYGFCFKFCFCEGLVKFFYKYKVILGYTGYKPTMDNDTAMGGLFGTCWKWKLLQFPLLENCKTKQRAHSKIYLLEQMLWTAK